MFSLQVLKAATRAGRTAGKASRNRPWRRCLRHEPLEDRTLLSLSAGMGPGEFAPGEILLGFEGEVAAAFADRGETAALHAANGQVGGFGLNAPDVLFELPGNENRAARLATHWQLPAGADVLDVVAQLSGLPGIAYLGSATLGQRIDVSCLCITSWVKVDPLGRAETSDFRN